MAESKDVEVYWGGLPAFASWSPFNHHFIAFVTRGKMEKSKEVNGYKFVTFSVADKDMKLYENVAGDIDNMRNWLKSGKKVKGKGFQLNKVPPPYKTGRVFAGKVVRVINVYNANLSKKPLPRTAFGTVIKFIDSKQDHKGWSPMTNCATVVNSVFKAAGVSSIVREKSGDFDGFDWGEDAELDISHFR